MIFWEKPALSPRWKRSLTALSCLGLLWGGLATARAEEAPAGASVFVVESVDGEYQAVEKPAGEVQVNLAVGRTTILTDEALAELLGFPVAFPESLAGGYRLREKTVGLGLDAPVDYREALRLQDGMLKAIEDAAEFSQLEAYRPERHVSGIYTKGQGTLVCITVRRAPPAEQEPESEPGARDGRVAIGATFGYWIETPGADYPLQIEGGVGTADMSRKPERIRAEHCLAWETQGLSYLMSFAQGPSLPLDEAAPLAASFLDGQDRR